MLKKVSSYSLIIIFVFSLLQFTVNAQSIFPDLPENHWAYSSVTALVNDGTVKGFEDGEFKPDNTVSRAEFVKMLGKSSERLEKDFTDVDPSHWGYEYIMYSGLEGIDNKFNPDTAITRYDVINLIWKRNGSKKGIVSPSIITSQGKNKDAIAWGYTYGIMVGDDGVNLRLEDSLSRAEAATLITRARAINESSPKKDFINTVSPKVLETIFGSIKLFDDIKYDENRTITNGEMARAALRLGSDEFTLTYRNYTVKSLFDHKYSMDLYAVGNDCIGLDKVNKEFIDKPATMQDTLTALTYNMIKKSHTGVVYGNTNNYYKDVTKAEKLMMNISLTFGYENNIQLYADASIKPDKPITLKEFACILLQLDNLIGSQTEITTDFINNSNNQVIKDSKIRSYMAQYPSNYKDYQNILKQIPNEVYTASFADNTKQNKPISSYDFSREFGFIFTNMLQEIKSSCETDKNVKLRFTYYPSLVCDNGNGATIRIKVDVLECLGDKSVKDVFKTYTDIANAPKLYKGMTFYADIVTGQPLTDIYISSKLAMLKQIVYIEDKK